MGRRPAAAVPNGACRDPFLPGFSTFPQLKSTRGEVLVAILKRSEEVQLPTRLARVLLENLPVFFLFPFIRGSWEEGEQEAAGVAGL